MRTGAASLQTSDQLVNEYTYRAVDTVQDVAAIIQEAVTDLPGQFGLVTITVYFEDEGKASAARLAQINRSVHYLLENLRRLVRKTDVVLMSHHTFYFLLLGANLQGGNIVQERLWEALLWRVHSTNEADILRPRSMTIGHSSYPLPCGDIGQFMAAASKGQLSFDLYPEKATRKLVAQHVRRSSPRQSGDGELPELARKLGIPYLSLLPRKLPARVQQLVSPQLAQELRCYPLGRERDILTVAMLNPQDRRALDRLHQETGLHIFPVLAHPRELQTALEQLAR